jgi:hypothetical protein
VFHARIEREAARPASISPADRPAWWQTRTAALLLILAAAIPLLFPGTLPFVDLPGHMGRYRIELDVARSADLQRYFSFHWTVIGNMGADLLVYPLAKLFGLELAVRLLVTAIPPLTVAGFLAVAKQAHGRIPATALLALPLAYSQPFNWGFINYTLSMAFAFLAFAWWLRLGAQQRFRFRSAIFIPLCAALYMAHAGGWTAFCLMAFASEVVRHRKAGAEWVSALAASVRQCLVFTLPIAMMVIWRGNGIQTTFADWFGLKVKLFWLLTLFRYNSEGFETACAALTLGALGLLAIRLRKSFSPALTLGAALLFAMFLVLPWKVFGSAYADMRLIPYVVALALLAPKLPDESGRTACEIAFAGLFFFAVVLGVRTLSFAQASREQAQELAALAHIPPGADVTTLARQDCDDYWNIPVNAHLGSYAIIRRNAFSNDQWLTPGINLLGLRDKVHGGFAQDPSEMVTPNRCPIVRYATRVDPTVASATRGPSDYLWLIDIQPDDPRVLNGWQRIWRYKDSALYRRAA